MANRVFKIGEVQSAGGKDAVYRDVSMLSRAYSRKGQQKYKIESLIDANAVQNSLRQIFTWIPGERIINPEFGSKLQFYIYEQITEENQEAIMAEIRHCVSEWEPRAIIDRVVNVTGVDDVERNTVQIDIYYHIAGLENQQLKYSSVFKLHSR